MILSTGGLLVPGGCLLLGGVPGPRGCVCSRGRGGSWSQAGVCFQGGAWSRGVSAPRGVPGHGGCLLRGGCLVETPTGRLLLRAVRILLECILVSESDFRSQSTSERIQRSFPKISESDYINYFNNFQITF